MVTKDLRQVFEKYHDVYSREQDEDLVLSGARDVERMLEDILLKFLFDPAGEREELVGKDKPIKTFSSKINLAYRLGLISLGLSQELHLLRKIRKEFVNNIDCATLDYKDVKEFCSNLKAPLTLKKKSKILNEKFPDTPRGHFELTIIILSCLLDDTLESMKKIQSIPKH